MPNQTLQGKTEPHIIINGNLEDFIVTYTKNVEYVVEDEPENKKEQRQKEKEEFNNDFKEKEIIKLINLLDGYRSDDYNEWISYIEDRPFNDKRYYISNEKVKKLGWTINVDFMEGLTDLVNNNYM